MHRADFRKLCIATGFLRFRNVLISDRKKQLRKVNVVSGLQPNIANTSSFSFSLRSSLQSLINLKICQYVNLLKSDFDQKYPLPQNLNSKSVPVPIKGQILGRNTKKKKSMYKYIHIGYLFIILFTLNFFLQSSFGTIKKSYVHLKNHS